MLVEIILLYKKFCVDLEKIVFEFNPYGPCVTNRIQVGTKHTVRFHVDNVISSHVNPNVFNNFKNWMNHYYGKHGKVKANSKITEVPCNSL